MLGLFMPGMSEGICDGREKHKKGPESCLKDNSSKPTGNNLNSILEFTLPS